MKWLKFLWRDKVDLIMWLITVGIAVYAIAKNVTTEHCWLAMAAFWMFWAMYRMNEFLKK